MKAIKKEAIDLGTTEVTREQTLWDKMLQARKESKVSLWRGRLLTASWKETEGLPTPIRRAKAFEKIVTEIPIFIDDGQLLPGDFAASTVALEFYPETGVDWVFDEILGTPAGERPFGLADEDKEELTEICKYWKGRNLQDAYLNLLTEEEKERLLDVTEKRAWVFWGLSNMLVERGYICANTNKVITQGLLASIAEVESELAALPVQDRRSHDKANFLKALLIALRAGIKYVSRYAALARELAKTARGERKAELERMAEACDWVPANPARSFYEAVLSAWLFHVLIFLDTRTHNNSFGRLDQYFYPYYKRDIENGKLTREEALEMLECLRIKCSTLRLLFGFHLREVASGELQFHNVTIGGQTPNGEDATNEVSYLILEAASRVRTPHHTISIRMHDNTPQEFAMKAAELTSLGLGYPAFFGDKSNILYLASRGIPIEVARDYAIGGCVQPVIPGHFGYIHPIHMSAGKCFEMALHDGHDSRTGKQLGPKTGNFEDFKTYDEVVEATKKQLSFFAHEGARFISSETVLRSVVQPVLIDSALGADCIKKGDDMLGNGGRWQFPIQTWHGMIDTANSLAAIKKCVFEDKSISKKELMEALSANFEGEKNEKIRRLLLAVPKYGNDDDYVDQIAADLYRWYIEITGSIEGDNGVKFAPATYSSTFHGGAGDRVGALPSGRKARVAFADGSTSPSQGTDVKGPTAVMKSAGKLDQARLFGTLMNMKFLPSSLKTREDYTKFIALIKTYFDYDGKHVQFNVINRETLMEAQAHPDQHRNLVVRVAGYSAYFVELSRSIQDEIISRTGHTWG